MMLNCPPNVEGGLVCPTAAQIANLTLAINKGFITWHAFPFNSEYELYSPTMLSASIARCHSLDDFFGQPRKATASQRDVPGTTRSAIPALLSSGVTVFSNGVNGASTPPFVPRAFVWSDATSGKTLPTLIHPYGYGGIDFEDAVIVPGLSHALVFAWRGDNQGPPDSINEIASDFASVQKTWPNAKVIFSTFDNFTAHLLDPSVLSQLPVVTSELGDTWIHGAGSDPIRTGFFKRASVLLGQCMRAGGCALSDPVIQNFTRFSAKCGEHTWGKDVKSYLHDETHWTNAELQQQLSSQAPNFIGFVASLQEQRDWCVGLPIAALRDAGHALAAPMQAALDDLFAASQPDTTGFAKFGAGNVYNAGSWSIAFSAADGGITMLSYGSGASQVVWAQQSDGGFLAKPWYVTLSGADYDIYTGGEPGGYYPQSGDSPDWFKLDFGKPNVSSANPVHQEVPPVVDTILLLEEADRATFLVQSHFLDNSLHSYYGAPQTMWTRVEVPLGAGAAGAINVTFEIFGKTATRLPEGMFIRFNVSDDNGASTLSSRINSVGGAIDPFDVVPGGNHHNHGFAGEDGGGISVSKGGHTLSLRSDSVGIATAGIPQFLPAPVFANSTNPSEGLGFLLIDQGWGTNYAQWFPFLDSDGNSFRWRYTIEST